MPRCFEKVLYHGTKPESVASIMAEGLKPTYMGEIVCMAPTPEIAKNFGEVVLEVDVNGYDLSAFEDCLEWERFCWTKGQVIPPERIKVLDGH